MSNVLELFERMPPALESMFDAVSKGTVLMLLAVATVAVLRRPGSRTNRWPIRHRSPIDLPIWPQNLRAEGGLRGVHAAVVELSVSSATRRVGQAGRSHDD